MARLFVSERERESEARGLQRVEDEEIYIDPDQKSSFLIFPLVRMISAFRVSCEQTQHSHTITTTTKPHTNTPINRVRLSSFVVVCTQCTHHAHLFAYNIPHTTLYIPDDLCANKTRPLQPLPNNPKCVVDVRCGVRMCVCLSLCLCTKPKK